MELAAQMDQYEREAEALIPDRIEQLRGLSFTRAAELPVSVSEDTMVARRKCLLNTYAQRTSGSEVVVSVQVARHAFLGLWGDHAERGLVFRAGGSTRNATPEELIASGG